MKYQKIRIIISIVGVVFASGLFSIAQALPYSPGQTLNPTCNPGDPNCTVRGVIIDNGIVAGVNATSSAVSFNIQGSGAIDPFDISSSTGVSLFHVSSNGFVGVGSSSPSAGFFIQGPNAIIPQFQISYGTPGPAGAFGIDVGNIATTTSIVKITPTQGGYLPDNTGVYNLLELAHRDRFGSSQGVGGAILFSADNGGTSDTQKARIVQYQAIAGSTGSALVIQQNRNNIWNPGITIGFTGNISMGIITTGQAVAYVDPLNSRLLVQGSTSDSSANAYTVLNSSTSTLFTIRNDGHIGVGTTALTNAIFNISGTSSSPSLAPLDVASSTGTSIFRVNANSSVGINASAPVGDFQVTTAATNATTTMEIGKSGQSKGTCLKIYDAAGTAWYITVSTSGVLSASATTCNSGF